MASTPFFVSWESARNTYGVSETFLGNKKFYAHEWERKIVAIKTILGVLLITVVVTIISICIKIAMDGCWIVFFPIDEKVETVTIEYPKLTQEPKEIIEPEDIERCVNMLNMLNYDMLKKSKDESDMLVTYTYHLKDGTALVVSANNETVLYKGKRYVLKEEKLFVKVTEALFFLKEIAEW